MQVFSSIVDNIETLKKRAIEGDADAQNKIGICYKLGPHKLATEKGKEIARNTDYRKLMGG
jgi:hypothetical protein